MGLTRLDLINSYAKERGSKVYLEIGVFLGKVFFFVNAPRKIAVDPDFRFGFYRKFKRVFKKINNIAAKFFKQTSDEFFAENAPRLFAQKKIDICLVDGMHEYQFALRDVENTLKYLNRNGLIIMHDCNPREAENAVSYREWENRGFTEDWSGDVWKAVLHLRSYRDDINVFVLDCDYGLGIITIGEPEAKLDFTKEEIEDLTFEQLEQNRKQWLNLKEPTYFFEYFGLRTEV